MDARRNRRGHDDTVLSKSNSSLPGLIVLSIGILFLIASICLFAVFGFPKNVSEEPKKLSGVIALGVGVLLTAIGVIVSVCLKKKRDKRRKELARQKKAKVSPNVHSLPAYSHNPPPAYQDVPGQQRNYKHKHMSPVSS